MSTNTRSARNKRVSDPRPAATRSKYFESDDDEDDLTAATPTKAKPNGKPRSTKNSPAKATPTKSKPVKTKSRASSNGNNNKASPPKKKTRKPVQYDTDDEEEDPSELSSIDTPEPDDVYAEAEPSEDGHREELDSDALDEDTDDYDIHAAPKKAPGEPDSDSLDEDDFDFEGAKDVNGKSKKRKRVPASPTKSKKSTSASPKKASPRKRRKTKDEDEDDEEYDDEDLGDGQEIVGKVVKAPKTGRVPAGQISQNTLNFLAELKVPEQNDREWFKLHEPVYRLAEQEWKDFVEQFTDDLIEVDPQIPPLPPKDVIHRIYRDIRFSNDKTPYKTGFSASFSRSGRKGIFAGYHIAIKPDGESLLAAGTWCPGKNELATIRSHIQHSPTRLRKIITNPSFVKLFGEGKPHPKGARRNIFGMDDELKVAPKGVAKDHPDIDLLKCRSFAVVCRFTDEQVLKKDFREELKRVIEITKPMVYCLNDYMTVGVGDDNDDDDGDDQEGNEAGDG